MEISNQQIKYLSLNPSSPQDVWNSLRYRIFLKHGIDVGEYHGKN